jgi:hypothetical protein
MRESRGHFSSVVYRDKIWAIGGWDPYNKVARPPALLPHPDPLQHGLLPEFPVTTNKELNLFHEQRA